MTNILYSWQLPQWELLLKMKAQGKLPHAQLFYGIQGIGKLSFAIMLAQHLLCKMPDDLPCGHCKSCLLFQNNQHPDYQLICPEENSQSIKVDQIRELKQSVYQKSHGGQYKIILIEPAEKMNVAASNALLKLLEEPSENTLLILISHHHEWLSATIRSRCQMVHFPPVTEQHFRNYCQEKNIDLNPQWLALCHGAPLRLESLIEKKYFLLAEDLKSSLSDLILGKTNAVSIAEKLKEGDWDDILELLLMLNVEERKTQCINYKIYDKLIEMKKQFKLGANINKQLWLEDVLLDYEKA